MSATPADRPQPRPTALGIEPLPVVRAPLLGRDEELAAARRFLASPEVGLLTLTGPGGMGKTRLALHLAAEPGIAFADGVCFVHLAPVRDADLAPATIARALGIPEAADRPPRATLVAALRDRHLLLVLDNCEQLLPALALLVAELLAACPRLTVLATSRAALRLFDEQEYPVPPLALPDAGQKLTAESVAEYAAPALFLRRARAVKPDFAFTDATAPAVAAICRRLDGLPLAIELAATRSKVLPPWALLERLRRRLPLLSEGARDLPGRQQTLRDTIAWSFDLLTEDERALFARLAVFVGGCTLEAAEAVGAAHDGDSAAVLAQLNALIDKSLLWQREGADGSARYGMLETIREFAAERLATNGEEEATRRQHAAYFLSLAERAEPALWGKSDLRSWVVRLAADNDNLDAALTWSETCGDAELGLRLAGALGRFWLISGQSSEGRRWLAAALARGAGAPPAARALALHWAGKLAVEQGDLAAAVPQSEESLALYRQLGDDRMAASTLFGLGHLWLNRADGRRAALLLEESLALSRGRDHEWIGVRGLPLAIFGWLLLGEGNQARGTATLEEALALGRGQGDPVATACALLGLGWAAHYAGDTAGALAQLELALSTHRESGHHLGILDALNSIGWVSLHQGNWARATALFGESLTIAAERGARAHLADALRGLGGVAGRTGRPEVAARRFGAAEQLVERAGQTAYPSRPAYARELAHARAQLDVATWVATWEAGWGMPLEAVVAQTTGERYQTEPRYSIPPTTTPIGAGTTGRSIYPFGLTAREVEVLRLVAEEMTDAQAADRLSLSPRTVGQHLRSVYNKLGVENRAAATRLAVERGLA